MLLMAEKDIRGRICHSVYRYAKALNKNMKYCDKNQESSYIQYGMQRIYMAGECC